GATQLLRDAHGARAIGGEQPLFHARLVIGAGEKFGVVLEHLLLELGAHRIVAPGFADEGSRFFPVALRNERARKGKTPSGALRRRLFEEGKHLCRLYILAPEPLLRVASEESNARPVGIGGNKRVVPLASDAAVAAQNDPLDKLARRRIGECG